MCVSPIEIKNPNYGNSTPLIQATTDTESQYIKVPCGVCSECLAQRQMDIVQRVRVMSLDSYIFFCTLTYSPEFLPHLRCSNGFDIAYADLSDVQKMFKRIRRGNLFPRDFKYLFVSERGKTRGRPHFHGLIFIPKLPNDDKLLPAQFETAVRRTLFNEWRRNYGSNRVPDWKPLFRYKEVFKNGRLHKNFDCHYVVPHSTEHGSDDVAFYVSKYVLKSSDKEKRLQQALRLNLVTENEDGTLDTSEYEEVWKIVRSRCVWSHHFGASSQTQINHIRSSIKKSCSDADGFKYFASNGSTQPLARYYRKFVGLEDALSSVAARGGPLALKPERDPGELDNSIARGERIQIAVSKRDLSEDFPDD